MENKGFSCLFQPTVKEVLNRDYALKGRWREEVFKNNNPIVLELGCGKGEYTIALAERSPERNYIGVDIKGARLWKGAKYSTEHNLSNVAFIRSRIDFIDSFFEKGEVAEIWITFADPQIEKPRKRLTSPLFLERYSRFLQADSIIHLKTDSPVLYESTLNVIAQRGHTLLESNSDIYGSGRASEDDILSVKTFYEKQFLAKGLPITYIRFQL